MPLIDFIEQRLKSDPVARKILAMEETATRELDTQALEQILIGHMMAIAGEANQIFRPVTMFDYGIDGEVEFKDNDGKASGKKIYVQLKSGNSYLRTRKSDGSEVFDVKNERHLEYWISQPVDVYLVIRQTDETSGEQTIRWMNVTRYLKNRKDKTEPPDRLRRREARHGGGVEGARCSSSRRRGKGHRFDNAVSRPSGDITMTKHIQPSATRETGRPRALRNPASRRRSLSP